MKSFCFFLLLRFKVNHRIIHFSLIKSWYRGARRRKGNVEDEKRKRIQRKSKQIEKVSPQKYEEKVSAQTEFFSDLSLSSSIWSWSNLISLHVHCTFSFSIWINYRALVMHDLCCANFFAKRNFLFRHRRLVARACSRSKTFRSRKM